MVEQARAGQAERARAAAEVDVGAFGDEVKIGARRGGRVCGYAGRWHVGYSEGDVRHHSTRRCG
jgi:hypothetical protein